MAIEERDPHTGYLTTGHEWNGIKELNSPVPRVIYAFLGATVIFSVIYWILMPAWPTGRDYTRGLLGLDQRSSVTKSLEAATRERESWTSRIGSESYGEIEADPALMTIVRDTGRTLFGDNCAACHGRNAEGGPGFPNLTTSAWLWGGEPEIIAETIRVGINSAHPESRVGQMMAFGRDGMLPRGDVENVVAYVRSLSAPDGADIDPERIAAGREIFATNCASCHGEDGKGKIDVGAPDLTDDVWIYGGDPRSVFNTIWGGRQGHMPTCESRLSPVDRKILALYLTDLRKAAP